MSKTELFKFIDSYVNKYFISNQDDIRLDKGIKSLFQKITDFRKKSEKVNIEVSPTDIQKIQVINAMAGSYATSREIEELMNQMEETSSQRLLRMISERNMSYAEAYTKAHVDRRHFSKIRKDKNYSPNKKTVLAFSIALELTLDETKELLACAGFALSRSSKMDIIVAYFLQNKIYDMFEVNEILDVYNQPIFE